MASTFASLRVCVDSTCKIPGWHEAHEGFSSKDAMYVKKELEDRVKGFMKWTESILPPRFYREDGAGIF